MNEILEEYSDRFRYIKYRPKAKDYAWVLGIRGVEKEVDGRIQREKDIKIYSPYFEGLIKHS